MKRHRTVAAERKRDDRGATIVLLGLVLAVLMIFAAFTVDIGTAYAQKRQNQGSVDTAADADGVYFLYKGGDFESMVKEVKDRIEQDMGTKVSEADWSACTDPNALPIPSTAPGFAPIDGTPCISFERDPDTNTLEMRVRLPDVASTTNFASVIGIDKLTTHAVAHVNIGSPLGGAFPAYVFSGTGPGAVVCVLNVGANGHIAPCADQGAGQRGLFAPYYYAQAGCPSGGQGTGIGWSSPAPAMAEGVDHLLAADKTLTVDPPGPFPNARVNGGGSPPCSVLGPNTLDNLEGGNFSGEGVTAGMVVGQHGSQPEYDGRLANGPYRDGDGGKLNIVEIANVRIDNAPLWYFLKDPLPAGSPTACQVAAQMPMKRDVLASLQLAAVAGVTKPDGSAPKKPEDVMAACLAEWTPAIGPIFDTSFVRSQRAVAVPRYWETTEVPNGTYHIRDFVPVFLTGEFDALPPGQASGGPDEVAADPKASHWAGDPMPNGPVYNAWNGGNAFKKIEGVAGIYVPCGALPEGICVASDTPGNDGFGGEVHGVTLTH